MTRCSSSTFALARPKVPSCFLSIGIRISFNGNTYPLLSQLTGTLVLAVSEKFDNTTLIWCKTILCQSQFPLLLRRIGAYPETSLTISLTKAVRLLKWPLVLETRGFTTLASVFCTHQVSPSSSFTNKRLCPSSSFFRERNEDPPRGETGYAKWFLFSQMRKSVFRLSSLSSLLLENDGMDREWGVIRGLC